jgi:hypothetical protein
MNGLKNGTIYQLRIEIMIKSEIDATVAAIRALRKAGGKDVQFSASEREKAAMIHRMDKARKIEDRRIDKE